MCKLSLNIVPNVYNSLQSSFLSLAWPWPSRSLPKGNQWEWWDPRQGPLPGLGEVGHSPRGTSGNSGTLDLVPMWLGSQSTCHPNAPPTPPDMLPNGPPTCPTTLGAPQCPLIPPIPLLASEHLHSLPAQCTPDTPYTSWWPQTPPNAPWFGLYPCWSLNTYTPCQTPNAPWHLLHPWQPQCPLMLLHP